jgi:hypothetical protein
MQNLFGNIRYSLRQFRHSPVFTAAAVLTLALGIGGTTAIFSLIHTVMLRSLPVADPATLYRIGDGNDCCVEGGPQDRWGMYSYPLFQRLKENLPEFEELAAFQAGPNRMSVRRESDRVAKPLRSEYVTGNYFSTFGIRPFVGRLFANDDDQPASAPVTVISYHVWQSTYGSDPKVVGSTFMLHRDRRRASGIFRRNAAQRSTRYLGTATAGADGAGQREFTPAAIGFRLAAGDRKTKARGERQRHVGAPDGYAAPVDDDRQRLSRELAR